MTDLGGERERGRPVSDSSKRLGWGFLLLLLLLLSLSLLCSCSRSCSRSCSFLLPSPSLFLTPSPSPFLAPLLVPCSTSYSAPSSPLYSSSARSNEHLDSCQQQSRTEGEEFFPFVTAGPRSRERRRRNREFFFFLAHLFSFWKETKQKRWALTGSLPPGCGRAARWASSRCPMVLKGGRSTWITSSPAREPRQTGSTRETQTLSL